MIEDGEAAWLFRQTPKQRRIVMQGTTKALFVSLWFFATLFRRSEVANPDLPAMFSGSGKMRRAFLFYAAAVGLELLAGPSPAQPPSAPEHFRFRFPQPATYRLEERGASRPTPAGPGEWLGAWREDGSSNRVEFGSRVVLEIESTNRLRPLLEGSPLTLSRVVASNVFILQAPAAL